MTRMVALVLSMVIMTTTVSTSAVYASEMPAELADLIKELPKLERSTFFQLGTFIIKRGEDGIVDGTRIGKVYVIPEDEHGGKIAFATMDVDRSGTFSAGDVIGVGYKGMVAEALGRKIVLISVTRDKVVPLVGNRLELQLVLIELQRLVALKHPG